MEKNKKGAYVLMALNAFANTGVTIPATQIAQDWDQLYHFLILLSAIFFVLIVGSMFYLIIKYRHKPGVLTQKIHAPSWLEGLFITLPTILLLGIFGWGYFVYQAMVTVPDQTYEVRVLAKQWSWTFQYPDGRITNSELIVPLHRPVKLLMSSEDVLHSFFVPNFRIKQDVVPGMYSTLWFKATVAGRHQIFCAEYCGASHSNMLAQLFVLPEKEFKLWELGKSLHKEEENTQASVPSFSITKLAEQGKKVYHKIGCAGCHSETNHSDNKIGPPLANVFGSKLVMSDNTEIQVDENFLRKKIQNPRKMILKGYQDVMPTFQGVLSELELNALIAYLKSI